MSDMLFDREEFIRTDEVDGEQSDESLHSFDEVEGCPRLALGIEKYKEH